MANNNLTESEPQSFFSATLSYHGAPFAGFARQPGQLTVQDNIEGALEVLFGCPVKTVCAGRTDAGVHARDQVISFSVPTRALRGRAPRTLLRSLNALTHDKIAVHTLEECDNNFSARFSATSREYRYFICTQAEPPIFIHDFSWHVPQPLDVARMREAAHVLEGEHDFASFCVAASAKGKPTHRFVSEIRLEQTCVMGEPVLMIIVKGNAFLHSMVRTMVGTLVKVGTGHREVEWVSRVLAACDRRQAGDTAPACGLVLWNVRYDEERCPFAPDHDDATCESLTTVATFRHVGTGRDGKLCLYEDAHGHLVAVRSSRLA